MIKHIKGNIFDVPYLTHIVHQANLYHTFGAGIAKQIRQKFPEAYNADLATRYGDKSKLGKYSAAQVDKRVIINLYSQIGISSKERTTSYNHLEQGLWAIRSWLSSMDDNPVLGIPHGIGCGLAGGRWETVLATIKTVFRDVPFDVVICKRNA